MAALHDDSSKVVCTEAQWNLVRVFPVKHSFWGPACLLCTTTNLQRQTGESLAVYRRLLVDQ